MTRNLMPIALICLLLLIPAQALAEGEGEGVIEGQIINGTTAAPADSVAGLTVSLYIFEEGKEEVVIESDTETEGSFRFTGLSTDGNVVYALSVEYQGVRYATDFVTFPEGEKSLSLPLTVYELTADDQWLRLERVHIIADLRTRNLVVGEFYLFNNVGDRTYIGGRDVAEGEGKAILEFTLPQDATDLRFRNPELADAAVQTEGGLAFTLPLPPGPSEVLFSYVLPFEPPAFNFERTLDYLVEDLNVLILDVGQTVSVAPLTPQGKLGGEGTTYFNFSGEKIARGITLSFELSDIPAEIALPEPDAEVARQAPEGELAVPSWFPLALAALGLVGVVAYAYLRGKPGPTVPSPPAVELAAERDVSFQALEARRLRLLHELADIDDAYDAGEMAKEEYERKRGEKKEELLTLLQQLAERSAPPPPTSAK
ncbi:MAG: hypothetical protein ACE5NP_05635 [Anaerolineae bacterium]